MFYLIILSFITYLFKHLNNNFLENEASNEKILFFILYLFSQIKTDLLPISSSNSQLNEFKYTW